MFSVARRLVTISAFVAAAALSASAEDLTIVSVVKTGENQATSTQYLTPARTRHSAAENDTIVEFTTGRIVGINHKKKEYYETSLAEMEATFQKMAADFEKMPAFVRKTMGADVRPVTVQKGTATRKIAGYDCTQYTLAMGEDLVFDLWVAPALEVPARYVDAFSAPYAAMGPAGRRFEAMFSEMKKIKGVALATGMRYKLVGKKFDTLTEATEVRRGPIPESAFAIPAGYKKTKSPLAR
jgi:hypothetical protein